MRTSLFAILVLAISIAQSGSGAAQGPAQPAGDPANGGSGYPQSWVLCQGDVGNGGPGGGAPLDTVDLATAVQTVGDGRNTMPSFRGVLTSEQIRDVTAYVVGPLRGQ